MTLLYENGLHTKNNKNNNTSPLGRIICAINIATTVFVWNVDISRVMRKQDPTWHGGSNIVFNLQVVIYFTVSVYSLKIKFILFLLH